MHLNAYHYTGSSIDSRFMQLEMSVSSTSLKRFSPSKSLFMRGLEGTTRHISMRMEVLKVST
ncbi:hypothetical protein F2Q70_00006729 [Brassica cretica]|uniref:Uncharacterized protein n=1 Tax=Brassica cretica TaxID=69181 RepID=A0A8S9IU18_BRACR|nr:hypothetical protein F2Q68_00023400 [Brassica cretica]KAF2572357.1 hypothetical protein F2Q70_00006729 [Brassica cretica]